MNKISLEHAIYGNHTPLVRPAKGAEGILCTDPSGQCFLRVNNSNAPDGFVAYDVRHSDFVIRIIDDDAAAFYDFGEKQTPLLNHAPATLGLAPAGRADGGLASK